MGSVVLISAEIFLSLRYGVVGIEGANVSLNAITTISELASECGIFKMLSTNAGCSGLWESGLTVPCHAGTELRLAVYNVQTPTDALAWHQLHSEFAQGHHAHNRALILVSDAQHNFALRVDSSTEDLMSRWRNAKSIACRSWAIVVVVSLSINQVIPNVVLVCLWEEIHLTTQARIGITLGSLNVALDFSAKSLKLQIVLTVEIEFTKGWVVDLDLL